MIAITANANRDPKKVRTPFEPKQFLPFDRDRDEEPQRMTPEQTAAMFEALFGDKVTKMDA